MKYLAGPEAPTSVVTGWITSAAIFFNVGGILGIVGTIPLARFGRRPLFALYFAAAAVAIWVTFGVDWDPVTRTRLFFFDGLTIFGVVGAFSFYLPELFPTRLRGTGAGFCFNTGRYLAAIGPYAVGVALAASTPLEAIRWVALVPVAGLLLVPFIVETKQRAIVD
jgi:hypothetical protein